MENIIINVFGKDLVFRKWSDGWDDLKKEHFVFFENVKDKGKIDISTQRINQDTKPNFF